MLKGKLPEAKKLDSKRFEITGNLETKNAAPLIEIQKLLKAQQLLL